MSSTAPRLPFPLPTVGWQDGEIVLIDQTRLPGELVWRRCGDLPALAAAIRELAVRGAPAIGIAAAYGLALSWRLALAAGMSSAAALARLREDAAYLLATRPTAVNLAWALRRLEAAAAAAVAAGREPPAVLAELLAEADRVHQEDVAASRAMGLAGAALLPDVAAVLTHCNAGGLATGGYGTALGVIYAARELGKRVHVYADETRPLLQGARLTAWELAGQGIPVTVLCEGAAASLLRSGRVDVVITGADRIARNGDAANKIGTYPLAVLAREHGVPFYVAAPASTFDPEAASGRDIPIELRDGAEVLGLSGLPAGLTGVDAFNPAFDVTPAALIAAIITELGVMRPPYEDSLAAVMAAAGLRK